MITRVAVVDDDEITRVGTVAVLSAHDEIQVVGSYTHADAPIDWSGVDVAVVDASDHRCHHDHFPGVAVAQAIKADRASRCTVVVITGVLFDDAVRRRMREAGADFYYHRSELADAAMLVEIVLARCDRQPVPEPSDPEALFRLGITHRTRVNDAVAVAQAMGLTSGDAGLVQRGRERTQRRVAFNQQARLSPVTASGQPPDRPQDAPSLPQIDRFLRWATALRTR